MQERKPKTPMILPFLLGMVAQDPYIPLGFWAEAKAEGDEEGAEVLELMFGLPGESDEERERAIKTAREVQDLFNDASGQETGEHE